MAKKIKRKEDETKKMLVESIKEFAQAKNFSIREILDILKESISRVLKKKYGEDSNFTIIIDNEEGDIQILRERTVVHDLDVNDPAKEVPLSEALGIIEDVEVGETLMDYVDFSFFSRSEINKIKQNIINAVRSIEHKHIFEKYEALEGTIILIEIYKIGHWLNGKKGILAKHEGQEVFLPYEELSRNEIQKMEEAKRGRKGRSIPPLRVLIKRIQKDRSGAPLIIVSRKDNRFVEKLFEQEVPEIADGLIVIRKIARIPGRRSKVLVESLDNRIDPVGACVGVQGIRISAVVKELNDEKIDIIAYASNIKLLIERVLRPAKISSVEILEDEDGRKRARVLVAKDEIKKAVGPKGENVLLASRLTGYELEIVDDKMVVDIRIEEFSDEIPEEDIQKFIEAGFEYSRRIPGIPLDKLSEITGIPEEQLKEYIEIIKEEFRN